MASEVNPNWYRNGLTDEQYLALTGEAKREADGEYADAEKPAKAKKDAASE